MKIKDIHNNLRPREKLLKYGISTLSFCELLAIIIKNGTKEKNAIELANEIISIYPENLIEYINIQDLKNIKGIGLVKTCEILSILEIHKRLNKIKSHTKVKKIKNSDDAYNILIEEIDNINQEKLILLCLNTANNVISISTIFKGSLNECIIHPREIYNKAILENSCSIIIAHNHPSGDFNPSQEDKKITDIISESGKLLGIPLLDHLIITKNGYFSFKDQNIL